MGMYYAQIHLLEDCNLKCKHCYQQGDPRGAVLALSDFERVLSELAEVVEARERELSEKLTVQVNLTGGEPLLHKELLSYIDLIIKRKWRWGLLTNGILLNPDLTSELARRNPVFVQVSLEGNRKMNDQIRGKGTYRQILKGVDLLNKSGIKVLVSFTVNAKNFRSFHSLARTCRIHRVHKLWCDRYVGKDELTLSTKDFQRFLKILRFEMRRPTFLFKTKIKAERSLQFFAQPGENKEIYQCSAGRNLVVICANGDVLPCRRLPLLLGNIYEKKLPEIFEESQVWKSLQNCSIPDQCIGCDYRTLCRGGAKCITYAQTGKYQLRDVNCSTSLKSFLF